MLAIIYLLYSANSYSLLAGASLTVVLFYFYIKSNILIYKLKVKQQGKLINKVKGLVIIDSKSEVI